MKSTICVIIPFYQRQAQPLVNAITSVLDQQDVDRPIILIVDDGSPCPAEPIVREHFPGQERIKVIHQANAGAARARNKGLEVVPDGTAFLAFLDSDDSWSPRHLANALIVMDQGMDMYFSDHRREEWPTSKFDMLEPPLGEHDNLDSCNGLFRYLGDPLLPIFRQHLIQTSSVVLRWRTVRNLRFRVDLVLGEDEVYWLEAARLATGIGYCRQVEVYMGKGVNISQNPNCDRAREMRLIAQNLHFWKTLPQHLPNEPLLAELRRERIHRLHGNYAANMLSELARGRPPSPRDLARFTWRHPGWLPALSRLVVNGLWERIGVRK